MSRSRGTNFSTTTARTRRFVTMYLHNYHGGTNVEVDAGSIVAESSPLRSLLRAMMSWALLYSSIDDFRIVLANSIVGS